MSHTKVTGNQCTGVVCQVGSSNNGWNIIVPVNVAFSTHTHTHTHIVCGDENNGAIGSGAVMIKCDRKLQLNQLIVSLFDLLKNCYMLVAVSLNL